MAYIKPPKRKEKKSKADLRAHFERRWRERVDPVDPAPYGQLNQLIQNQPSEYLKGLGALTNDRSAYQVDWKGQPYKVIYNKKLHSVVTIYPM